MDEEIPEGFDPRQFFETLRKSASVKMGAVVFGEAQMAYYEVLKQHMEEEHAWNMLAHTTESIIKGIAGAAGPVVSALMQASFLWEMLGAEVQSEKGEKEVPGSQS
jgi:hypothetical protein